MPPVKKVLNKSEELFNVNGLSIKENAVYKIQNRYDAKAPTGFQKANSTKIPSSDVGNTVYCPYTVTNMATKAGIFNTGLYPHSPCYKGEDTLRINERMKVLKKYIVDPYEALKGEVGLLNQNNKEFWNAYPIELYDGRYFSTANPEDLLQLYIAMMAGELAPENNQGDPKYNEADFVIVDKAKEKTVKQRKAVSNIDSIGKFYVLLSENPQKLQNILRYIGIANITDKIDGVTVKTLFNNWIEMHDKNAEKFANIIDKCDNKTFEEVIYLYSTLRKISESGRALNKSASGDYIYNGVPLGKDLKIVAENLVSNSDLSEIKAQLLEEFDTK